MSEPPSLVVEQELGSPGLKRPELPVEIWHQITRTHVHELIDAYNVREFRFNSSCTSDLNNALIPLISVSPGWRNLVCSTWNSCWQRTPDDAAPRTEWETVLKRPVVYFEMKSIPSVDFPSYEGLRFMSLGFEDMFEYANSTWYPRISVIGLPPRLQELELSGYHAPEEQVIALLEQSRPSITTLRLNPCTIFNNPRCAWWVTHTFAQHHEHYFRGHDTVAVAAYAGSLGHALRNWSNLEKFVLNVHFTTFEIIDTHRTSHVEHHPHKHRDLRTWSEYLDLRNNNSAEYMAKWCAHSIYGPMKIPPPANPGSLCPPDRKLWTKRCPQCMELWFNSVVSAETHAAMTLARELPALKDVWFGSFAPRGHLCPSRWQVERRSAPSSLNGEAQMIGVDRSGMYSPSVRLVRQTHDGQLEEGYSVPGSFTITEAP